MICTCLCWHAHIHFDFWIFWDTSLTILFWFQHSRSITQFEPWQLKHCLLRRHRRRSRESRSPRKTTICCRNYCRPRCAEKTGDEGGEIMRTHQLMVSIPWTNLYFFGGVEKRILLVVDFETIHSDQNSSSCTVEIWNWSSHINSRQNVVSSSCQNRCELVLVLCTLEGERTEWSWFKCSTNWNLV